MAIAAQQAKIGQAEARIAAEHCRAPARGRT
jgi:hypothetical protein